MSFFSKSTETCNLTSVNIGRSLQRVRGHSHRHTFGFLGSHLSCGLHVCILLFLSSASNHTDIQDAIWQLDWDSVIPSLLITLGGCVVSHIYFPFFRLVVSPQLILVPRINSLLIVTQTFSLSPQTLPFRCFLLLCPLPPPPSHLHLFPGYFRKSSSHITFCHFSLDHKTKYVMNKGKMCVPRNILKWHKEINAITFLNLLQGLFSIYLSFYPC